MKIDTEMVVFLPKNSKGFVTFIFRGDKINEICGQNGRNVVVGRNVKQIFRGNC